MATRESRFPALVVADAWPAPLFAFLDIFEGSTSSFSAIFGRLDAAFDRAGALEFERTAMQVRMATLTAKSRKCRVYYRDLVSSERLSQSEDGEEPEGVVTS